MIAEQPNPAMIGLDLEAVIRLLHGRNIRVGIQTYGDGIRVWISDQLRVREERLLKHSNANSIGREDSVALWLQAGPRKRSARSVPVGRSDTKQPAGPSKCYRLKGHKVGNRS
jgi:hypothetical protein